MTHPMLATVAPAIPEFGALVGLFFAICGVVLARGAIATWTHSFGYLLEWLARELKFSIHTWVGTISVDLGKPFRAVDGWVMTALRDWLTGSEIEMTYFLHASTVLWDWTVAELEKLARDSLHWAAWSQTVFVPTIVKTIAGAAGATARAAKSVAVDAYELGLKGNRRVGQLEHGLEGRFRGWLRKWAPLVFPGILAIPGLIHEWHGISHWVARHQRRIARLEKLLGAAGMAAAMANALGLPDWRCITRGNLGRASRALCGLPGHWLDDLLGLIADFVVLENICVILPWLETGVSNVATPLVEALTIAGAGLCEPGATRPPRLELPQLYVPDTAFGQLYLP